MASEESEKEAQLSGKGGPGLGGGQEGLERSGPPDGMMGGDIGLIEGQPGPGAAANQEELEEDIVDENSGEA